MVSRFFDLASYMSDLNVDIGFAPGNLIVSGAYGVNFQGRPADLQL